MAQKDTSPSLAALPSELFDHIVTQLPNGDIKSLRLTSSALHNLVPLRLNRVFISANPLDIKVLREIADHEEFRKEVVEIIWDDTYFMNAKDITKPEVAALEEFDMPEKVRVHVNHTHHCPKWYYRKSRERIAELAKSKGNDTNRPDHLARMRQLAAQMSPHDSYTHYYELAEQQRRVLSSRADVHAFMYVLNRLPSLRRVTISTRAHGRLFTPMYETPTIRAFPFGFVHPPTIADPSDQNAHFLWGELSDEEWVRRKYFIYRRGLCSALRMLARHGNHNVSEFIVEEQGGSSRSLCDLIFTQQTRDDLISLLKRPSFRRLDLALAEIPHRTPDRIERSFIEMARSQTIGLQHMSLSNSLTAGDSIEGRAWDILTGPYINLPSHIFNLSAMFPVRQLKHLALRGVLIDKDELVALLASKPNLRSVELRFIRFAIRRQENWITYRHKSRNYRDFLYDVRDTLGWRDRPRALRPKLTIILTARTLVEGQIVRLDSAIDEFLYEDGENPFVPTPFQEDNHGVLSIPDVTAHELCSGKGIEVDEFEPAHERPNVDDETLSRLGITRETSYGRWETGPWGPQTLPTAQEQGLDESVPT
ncbi:hypothetical protein NW762_009984 [Fusarium torreyae]|uniref:F-box domain-containing protein n=1 Tax=Fusarium torreyae TaxID=1237075 RepID=A0A9W8RU06_9HYPO|nr:hypothetical protein NW762_009984 [Fusarium torreyae]